MAFCDLLYNVPRVGRPKFYVLDSCTHAVKEFKLLRRKPSANGEYLPTSFIGEDHMYDVCRYFATSYPSGDRPHTTEDEVERIRNYVLSLRKKQGEYSGRELVGMAGAANG